MNRIVPLIAVAMCGAFVGCHTAFVDRTAWIDALRPEGLPQPPTLRHGRWIRNTERSDVPVAGQLDARFDWRFVPGPSVEPESTPGDGADSTAADVWPRRPTPGPRRDTNGTVENDRLGDVNHLRSHARTNGIVGWHAAVLLARTHPSVALPAVEATLRHLVVDRPRYDPTTGMAVATAETTLAPAEAAEAGIPIEGSLQSAAAEAWVHLLGTTSADPIAGLKPVGVVLESRDLPAEVRAPLYRGAARWIAPARLPHVDAAVGELAYESTPPLVRRAVVEGCDVHALHHPESLNIAAWPHRIEEARWDPDPGVRIAYGRWVARTGADSALETLSEQLTDESPRVRTAAVAALGLYGTDAAREMLIALAGGTESGPRANAVSALAAWGPEAIAPYAAHESHRVRRAVAATCTHLRPRDLALRLLVDLVVDDNPMVEIAAVEAVVDWSDLEAGRVLLTAMEDGASSTRAFAHRALLRRLPDEVAYRQHASPERRRHSTRLIAQRLGLDGPMLPPIVEAPAPVDRVAELSAWLDELATAPEADRESLWERLRGVRADEIGHLERLLLDRPDPLVDEVVRESLATISSVHAALAALQEPDVRVRRRAAATIRDTAPESLSPFVLERLYAPLMREQDRIVWSCLHEAVRDDGSEEAGRLVRLTLEGPWPDLRMLGCEYVAAHPRPDRASWLLPLFASENTDLLRHAIRAAGRCGNPVAIEGLATDETPVPIGLRRLSLHADEGIRLEAAIALATLGDAVGVRELTRLSRSPDSEQRNRVLEAMGHSGQRAFAEPLLEAARDTRDPRRRRLALASLERLVDESDRPRIPPADRAPDAALEAWEQWWSARISGPSPVQ